MTTTALRLRSCPRCGEKLRAQHDHQGGFWYCIQCGFHSYTDVPPEPRIRRPEAMSGSYEVFTYDGGEEAFQGNTIRGQILPAKRNEAYVRYDLTCPYQGCRRRQLCVITEQHGKRKTYRCKAKHRISIHVEKLTWS